MDRKLAAGLAILVLVGLVVAAIVAGRAEEGSANAPAPFDQATGRCVGDEPVTRERCEGQLAQVESQH